VRTLDQALRERCRCTHEAGDSACPVHPSCDHCGCPPERHNVDDQELRECLDCGCEQYVDAWKSNLDARDGRSAEQASGDGGVKT
jgi:hypothetical protein